jgi:predicted ATPase/class 3 adenylate cyclase
MSRVELPVVGWGGIVGRAMATQPTGTVTLLFTDVEGSTRLLEQLGRERYAEVLELHRRLLRGAFDCHDGFEVGTEGDSFFVAFQRAENGVAAAGEAQQALAGAAWPDEVAVRVRMGLHTGEPLLADGNYVGMDVHRAARIMAAARGGQVLVSQTTAALLDGTPLRDLGPHRLKDLLEPIRLYQLEINGLPGEFPPLRSLHQTNLPLAAWPLLGRERELAKIRSLVAGGARLLTLTGPGGSGKTRLALQAAAELSDAFADGVFFVALASLRDTTAVRGAVAEAVGLQPDDDVTAWLASRRVLLVLDNLEHLQGVQAVVAELLVGETTILTTSRMPLRLSAERELPVEPLPQEAAVELFVSRAAAAGREVAANETVAAVCRRLDNLPLALELAAARAKLLSPSALLQRLDAALPLLTGGAHDLPERQRTLRATIEWSYDLLDSDAQAAFQRLSVFRGSFTLDAAETVTGADLDQIATLLDQSLLKPLGDDRFFMLETLREYAREQLDEAVETEDYALRHARHYLARLEADEAAYDSARRGELLAWYAEEEDNLRAMLDRLAEAAPDEASVAAFLLRRHWVGRSALSEGRERLRALLERTDLSPEARGRLLAALSVIEQWLGHLEASEAAAREGVELATATGQTRVLFESLRSLAWIADSRSDSEEAVRVQERALEVAASVDERCVALALHDLGVFLIGAGRSSEARRVLQQAAESARAVGYVDLELDAIANAAELDLHAHDFESAYRAYSSTYPRTGAEADGATSGIGMGLAALGLDRCEEARRLLAEALDWLLDASMTSHYDFARTLNGIALAADPGDARRAARLHGATAAVRARTEYTLKPEDEALERHFAQSLADALGPQAWEEEHAAGANLTLEETIALAGSLAQNTPTAAAPD